MSDLLDKVRWLLSIPSPTCQEQQIFEQMLSWCQRQLPQAHIQTFRCGFRVEPPSRNRQVRVALVGHLDTVPEADRQRTDVEGDRIFGCGASDMKSGVAVMMELLEHHLESSVDLVGLFYDREEGPYADNGLEPLLEGLPTVDFAVVLEPTLNQIQAGCVGSIQARVHFQGKRAHSARPWQGRNAIYEALPFLQRLAQVQPRSVFSQGLEFFEVLSATQAFSPGPSNAVPDRFTLNVNQRFAPGKPLPQAEQELRDWIGPGPEVEVLDGAPSGSVRLEHPRVRQWIDAHRLVVQPKQAWTDVARLDQRGIPAFNFGPGDPAQAHQADEWVEASRVIENYRLLRSLLQ